MDARSYYLMRKNDIITMVRLDEDGKIRTFSKNLTDHAKEIAPIAYASQPDNWIIKWWEERSIPVTRDHIKELLSKIGCSAPMYLAKNLGLSLNDYYWIKPADSDLTWESVNLYQNPFHDNILLSQKDPETDGIPRYSPNGSLQGDVEKTWTIIDNKRCLVKGNHSATSRESFNEIIACKIHELQGYDNYTDYRLLHIKGKPYEYGCVSESFTSLDRELIPAWAVCTSVEKRNSVSLYEHFINTCGKHGMDTERLRKDLEYQIMVDYILTGYDRHLNNISVLRDAKTLDFIRLAPVYDSGNCLFANREIPQDLHELQKMEITSFAKTELKQIKYVKDPYVVDLTKLPPASYIRSVYEKDEHISTEFVNKICEWYERKIDMCRSIQLG